MDNRQERVFLMIERVLVFLQRYPIDSEPPLLTRMKQELRASIERLDELRLEQVKATKAVKSGALRWMREHMRRDLLMPLVRIAKPLLKFAPGSSTCCAFRMHGPTPRPSPRMRWTRQRRSRRIPRS